MRRGGGGGVALTKRGKKVSVKSGKVTAKAMATTEAAPQTSKTSSKKKKTEDKAKETSLEVEAAGNPKKGKDKAKDQETSAGPAYDRKKEYCKERYALLHEADDPQHFCRPAGSELTARQSFIRKRLRTLIDERKAQEGDGGPTPSAKTFWAQVTAEWHASTKAEKARLATFDREVLAEAAAEPPTHTPAVAPIAKSEPMAPPVPVTSLGGSSGSPDKCLNPRGESGLMLRRAARRRLTSKMTVPAEPQAQGGEEAEAERVASTAALETAPDVEEEMCLSDLLAL
ncbi:MAG: hypothetical protein GY772_20570 [bacterium]|nr:hypothetical protein [bacterium]